MVFKDIQAILKLIPEFTIITTFLDKPRILKGRGALKFELGKIRVNLLGVFMRRSYA